MDYVVKEGESWPWFQCFDVVLAANALEHVANPFRVMREMALALHGDGLVIVTTPTNIQEHKEPLDCWRILPDGLRALFQSTILMPVEIGRLAGGPQDTWGVAQRR